MNPEHIALLKKLYSRLDDMIAACEDEDLKFILSKLKHDLGYQAPEALGYWGDKVGTALYQKFGSTPPTEGWQKKVVDAWILPRKQFEN